MEQVWIYWRAGLCLVLALQLVMPAGVWAVDSRDLQIEKLKEGAALWVLAIGVSKYQDPRIDLKYADNDAQRIAQILKTQEGLLFREVFTKVLVNEQATREEILKAMSEFLGQAVQEDVVLIFIAGHGLQDRQTKSYYFVPHNANTDNLVYAGLPMPMFEEAVKRLRINVNKLILWMDTCHAGAVSVSARGVNMGEDLAEALEQGSGQYVLSASKAGEESMEDDSYRFEAEERAHGAFTYSLLQGLRGAAKDTSGVVWLSDLFSHVSKEVPRLTTGKQHPHGQIEGTDLPLFVMDESVLTKLSTPLPLADRPSTSPPTGSSGSVATGGTIIPGAQKSGSKKWLWWLLGAGTAGGAAVATGVLPPKAAKLSPPPPTGSVVIDVEVP